MTTDKMAPFGMVAAFEIRGDDGEWSKSYQNMAFSVTNRKNPGPFATLDTRNLPADVTAQELGIIISMTLRIPAAWVSRDFAGAERFFAIESEKE